MPASAAAAVAAGGRWGDLDRPIGPGRRGIAAIGARVGNRMAWASFPTGAVPAPGTLGGLKVAYLTRANAICLGFELRGLSPSVNADVGAIHHLQTRAKPGEVARRARLTRQADAIEWAFVSGKV